jgi:hypothetical protein
MNPGQISFNSFSKRIKVGMVIASRTLIFFSLIFSKNQYACLGGYNVFAFAGGYKRT